MSEQTYIVMTCTAADKAEMQELLYAIDPLVFDIHSGGGLNGPLWDVNVTPVLDSDGGRIDPPTHWGLAGNIPTEVAELLGFN
jgi:hypothetical protein